MPLYPLSLNVNSNYNAIYQSDGDSNGIFYYLGTNKNSQAWSNPVLDNIVNISLSSFYTSLLSSSNISYNHPEYLVNGQENIFVATANIPNSYYLIDLKSYTLCPNYYSIRARNYDAQNPQNWQLQASADNINWDILDSRSNNPLSPNQWLSISLPNIVKSYRYFKIVETGLSTINNENNALPLGSSSYIFSLGQIEFYGLLSISNQEPIFSSFSRLTSSFYVSSFSANSRILSSIQLSKTFILLQLITYFPTRVRLYTASKYQQADINRAIGLTPTGDHGVIFDGVSNAGLLTINLAPIVVGSSLELIPTAFIPCTVDNLSSSNITDFSFDIAYLPLEL